MTTLREYIKEKKHKLNKDAMEHPYFGSELRRKRDAKIKLLQEILDYDDVGSTIDGYIKCNVCSSEIYRFDCPNCDKSIEVVDAELHEIVLKRKQLVALEEIKDLIKRWYSCYSISPSEMLWNDLKLLEAIRRDYE